MYYTYILRCKDDSLYTGITTDVMRRMKEHASGKGAKCTRLKGFDRLEAVWESENRATASRLEVRIKQLRRTQKIMLIERDRFCELLAEKLDTNDYRRVNIEIYA